MQHLVRFTTAEGREGQHTADSLAEALKFVERLRNGEDVSDVRVFRMQEIPINFRTYYKVEVSAETDEVAESGRDAGREPRPVLQDAALAGAAAAASGPAPMNASGQGPAAAVGFAAGAQVAGAPAAAGEGTGSEGGGRRLFIR